MKNNESVSNVDSEGLPLFYKKVRPLNKKVHGDYYIKNINGYKYTKETNSIYITVVEFIQSSCEYPIVFAKGKDEKIFPVVLIGLEKNKNLFVNDKGEWETNYIPAYVRRYPFILATTENSNNDFTICIDEEYLGFNTKKEGKALFDDNGNQQDYLKNAVDFLKEFQEQVTLTNLFCENLYKLDILETMQAKVELDTGDKYNLGGFMGVNRDKLKKIPTEKILELFNTDQMELIYAHLSSLHNINNLIKRAHKK